MYVYALCMYMFYIYIYICEIYKLTESVGLPIFYKKQINKKLQLQAKYIYMARRNTTTTNASAHHHNLSHRDYREHMYIPTTKKKKKKKTQDFQNVNKDQSKCTLSVAFFHVLFYVSFFLKVIAKKTLHA